MSSPLVTARACRRKRTPSSGYAARKTACARSLIAPCTCRAKSCSPSRKRRRPVMVAPFARAAPRPVVVAGGRGGAAPPAQLLPQVGGQRLGLCPRRQRRPEDVVPAVGQWRRGPRRDQDHAAAFRRGRGGAGRGGGGGGGAPPRAPR